MIFVIGAFFWILALAAVARLLYAGRTLVRKNAWLWGLLLLISAGLLFRPHEDVFGGEDPGSYLNSGVTYGRRGELAYIDPLLAQVPADTRSAFYYGHAGYGTTKDACLWVADSGTALLAPHFQPAYPLLIGVATRLGGNSWSLYVIPLFALLTGLVLAVLASRLLKHRLAGLIAFSCYLLNPLTLWHGRCARPEIIAGFMVLAGLALLLSAWQERRWMQWHDILLGALCIGAAPFFHITAWYLVIPAAIAVGLVILGGRTDFLLYPPAALGMLLLFYGQTWLVTDYYRVRHYFETAFDYWPFLALGLALLAGTSLLISRKRGRRTDNGHDPRGVSGKLAAVLALACALCLINLYFNRTSIGALPIMQFMPAGFNPLTDWQTYANMVSLPMVLLIFIGWLAWLTGDADRRPERIGLALIVLPALVLAGTMRDFMMTRYLLMAVVPVSALCLTALATRLPELPGRPWTAWLAPGLAAVICLTGLIQRGHLAALVEHRGFLRFLAPFAQTVRQDHGILLGEYSRITAPLEHMFGVPALGLDNERKDDYSSAERAWETIMRARPDQPAFFLTPFQTPRSDRFDFALVKHGIFNAKKLQQAYNYLPTRIQPTSLSLSLYRMTLKDSAHPAVIASGATELPLGNGNMGLRRLANVRVEKPALKGVELAPAEQISLTIPDNLRSGLQDLFFVISSADPRPMADIVSGADGLPPQWSKFQCRPLADQWRICVCRPVAPTVPGSIAITVRAPLFIAAAFGRRGTDAVEISAGFSKDKVSREFQQLTGRWARAEAFILLPASTAGHLAMLVYAPNVPAADSVPTITIGDRGGWTVSGNLQPGAWQWRLLPLPGGNDRDVWLRMQVQPAWNSGKAGFPSDLGVFFGHLILTQD